jgi:hypothetical protein
MGPEHDSLLPLSKAFEASSHPSALPTHGSTAELSPDGDRGLSWLAVCLEPAVESLHASIVLLERRTIGSRGAE